MPQNERTRCKEGDSRDLLNIFKLQFDSLNYLHPSDYWYMGKVPPMGANVAFSLYGALKGESFSGCNGNTFINSFYTNTGFQDYAKAMYYAGESGFSDYASDDDDSSSGLTAECSGGYGVGCDATYGFAVHTYSTDVCNPQYVTGVQDSLSDLNSALQATQCVKIYDSSQYNGYTEGTALELLYYSSACFYQNYYAPDGNCPDPYGKIAFYRNNFAKGLQREKRSQPYEIFTSEVKKGKTMVATGSLLVIAAIAVLAIEIYMSRTYKTKRTVDEEKSDGLVKPKTLERPIPEGEPYSMLETMKQSANQELEYRMAIFNGNVQRISDSINRAWNSGMELTSTKKTDKQADTEPQNHLHPSYVPKAQEQLNNMYPAQHSVPFTQLTPSPLPSQDESVPMNETEPASSLNVSRLTEATGLAGFDTASAPIGPAPIPIAADTTTSVDVHPELYDQVLASRASMESDEIKGMSRDLDDVIASEDTDDSSTLADRTLEAKIEAALQDSSRSVNVIAQTISTESSTGDMLTSPPSVANRAPTSEAQSASDTETVLVSYEDASPKP